MLNWLPFWVQNGGYSKFENMDQIEKGGKRRVYFVP